MVLSNFHITKNYFLERKMDLKEARGIVEGCEKLPADRYQEAVKLCIKDDAEPVEKLESVDVPPQDVD